MAKMSFEVRDVDRGYKKLQDAARKLAARGAYVKAGVLGGDKDRREGEPIGNVELAAIHEFGAPAANIPERSFIRSTFDKHREQYVNHLKKLLVHVYEGRMDLEKVLGIMGLKMTADIKSAVKSGSGIPPPLKESTVRSKGSSRPLVDTGQMINSVTHEVVTNGKK